MASGVMEAFISTFTGAKEVADRFNLEFLRLETPSHYQRHVILF